MKAIAQWAILIFLFLAGCWILAAALDLLFMPNQRLAIALYFLGAGGFWMLLVALLHRRNRP